MSFRSINMTWLRFVASSLLPSQFRAALVISPPGARQSRSTGYIHKNAATLHHCRGRRSAEWLGYFSITQAICRLPVQRSQLSPPSTKAPVVATRSRIRKHPAGIHTEAIPLAAIADLVACVHQRQRTANPHSPASLLGDCGNAIADNPIAACRNAGQSAPVAHKMRRAYGARDF
jgi:hypothetical protein